MTRVYGKGLNIMRAKVNSNYIQQYTPIKELEGRTIKFMKAGIYQSYFALDDGQIVLLGAQMFSYPISRIMWYHKKAPKLFQSWQKVGKIFGQSLSFTNYFQEPCLLNHKTTNENKDISHFQTGSSNLFFIQNGECYAMGENSHGQLGTTNATYKKSFQKIALPVNQSVIDVSSGFSHTLFATGRGQVYGCGKTSRSRIVPFQSSRTRTTKQQYDKPILISQNQNIVKVAAGMSHSIFLSKDNKIYGLGWNQYGQCGQNILKVKQLKQITETYCFFSKEQKIKDIKCGFHHTLIMTDKRVYFMGSTINKQYPFDKTMMSENICSPQPVPISGTPKKIFAAHDRSAILTDENKLYIFGGSKDSRQTGQLQVIEDDFINPNTEVALGYEHTLISV